MDTARTKITAKQCVAVDTAVQYDVLDISTNMPITCRETELDMQLLCHLLSLRCVPFCAACRVFKEIKLIDSIQMNKEYNFIQMLQSNCWLNHTHHMPDFHP